MIAFYAPWCGHCRTLEPKFTALAQQLKGEKGIGIGAIDCNEGTNKAICGKYGVNGFPTLKAMVAGKPKSYNGARETEPMKDWIMNILKNKGTKGGSAKCPTGVFKSKVKDATVSLCESHFPGAEAKNSWLVLFYDEQSSDAAALRDMANRVAEDLGNDPPDRSKALKKPVKQRERITGLGEKYNLALKMPKKGPFGMDAVAKVGGVCCDCKPKEENQQFCYDILGKHGNTTRPLAAWLRKGELQVYEQEPLPENLIAFALEKIGILSATGSKVDEL
mmetsp:Transcript_997/g.2505  ORF Transcript_997/g.2505 Transcript_997/m.2505 type:complete len:277 (+) Transcript_997:3-833(+)